MNNLLVSGCSFTNDYKFKTWPRYLHDLNPDARLYDVSFPGAGNFFIAESVIRTILSEKLDPADTLVIVMWSGVSRKDLIISEEFYNILDPSCKSKIFDVNFVHSGGQMGQWSQGGAPALLLKPIFENLYKTVDRTSMGYESLSNMLKLRTFLEQNGFTYKFMSYVDYWKETPDYIGQNLDFSLTYYNRNEPMLEQLGDNWIWADNSTCFYEYAKYRNLLDDDGFHPNIYAHESFATDIILPHIKDYI